jgi:tagaturonate reductase
MARLTRTYLQESGKTVGRSLCDPGKKYPERIVQFGEGNFLRGFADWMVDVINEQGLFGGQIVVVQPIRQGMADALNAQDGYYTLILRGIDHGKISESRRLIGSISRALDPYEQWAVLAAAFRTNELRFVISNTTEAGIVYVNEPYRAGQCPESFPAKITALLFERFQAVNGASYHGLVFLPCELIERNGPKLLAAVLGHADAWKLPADFAAWVKHANYFLNTLVDRIVPGYPHDEAATITKELGYEDRLLVAAEHFHLWVIEGPKHLAEEIPFHKAGLNVVWVDDLMPYRTRKVRVLNGAHTSGSLAAFNAGLNTVREMVVDPVFGPFLRKIIFEEILPLVPMPTQEKHAYAEDVLERFRNPFIRHELLSISLNSISKWKVRVLPSLWVYWAAKRSVPPGLAFSLAALIWFYHGEKVGANELRGQRDGQPYPIRDDVYPIEFFAHAWGSVKQRSDLKELAISVLAQKAFWDTDLNQVSDLADVVTDALQNISRHGMRHALALRGLS